MLVDPPTVAAGTPAWQAAIIPEGDHWILTVTLDPQACCGTWATRLTCRFRAADGSELPYTPSLRATASVPGLLSSSPASVIVGALDPGATSSLSLVLVGLPGWAGEPLRCMDEGQDSPDRPVYAQMSWSSPTGTVAAGRRWEGHLSATARAEAVMGQAGGGVVVECSDGTRLRIPYLAAVAPARTP
jgi:hypothetical protein